MNGRIYSVDIEPLREQFIPLKNILEQCVTDEKYYIKADELDRWEYCKGAKHEPRRRKDGTEYFFHEGAVAFPEDYHGTILA